MINYLAVSPYHDIYTNLAIERALFDSYSGGEILYLWSNDPCVVCGRNQNIYAEVNVDYASQHGIAISRRYTGGGAVYQDRGNLNYTIITQCQDISTVLASITEPLHNLGIQCTVNGRNDIMVGDKKISGFAYLVEEDRHMYHGTLLVDVNMEHLSNVLRPNKAKLLSKGISSIRARVGNMASMVEIDTDKLLQALTEGVQYQVIDISQLEYQHIAQQLSSTQWVYGQSPDFAHTIDVRLAGSSYTINIDVHNDIVVKCTVHTDSMCVDNVDVVTNCLLGVQYNKIHDALQQLDIAMSA